jgi:8-oxoguanine deaminase
MVTTKIFRKISHLVTMNQNRDELMHIDLYVRNGFVEAIVPSTEPQLFPVDEVVNLEGYIILPGLINTHHHFFQTLTRVVPAAQDANLFSWLKTLYPIWRNLTPECIYVSTQIALIELALTGCTTASDHLYIYPNGVSLDDEISGANQVGLRLHASRGSMSLGESKGGLPPDDLVEDENFILNESVRLIEKYHNHTPGSMIEIVIAPCSPFSVSTDLMRESAQLARDYGVHMHTHLAETKDEENYCLRNYGERPVDFMKQLNWLGDDVWFAHSVFINQNEIDIFAKSGCGVAHCPSSNMRLSSGIAPIKAMRKAGVKIGIGVDGSASNDSSHMLNEVRQAMLVSRLDSAMRNLTENDTQNDDTLLSSRQVLEMATIGGAAVLGRKDIGSIEPGKCADFFGVKLDKLAFAGALHDPLSALIFCGPVYADITVVGGNIIVKDSFIQTVNAEELIKKQNQLAKQLLQC